MRPSTYGDWWRKRGVSFHPKITIIEKLKLRHWNNNAQQINGFKWLTFYNIEDSSFMVKGSNVFRIILLLAGLLIFVAQPVSALTVSHVKTEPAGALASGTPVMASLQIDFPVSEIDQSPEMQDIVLITDLSEAKWNITYHGENAKNVMFSYNKRAVGILRDDFGNWISDPDVSQANLKSVYIVLNGYAPSVERTMNQTLIRVKTAGSVNNPTNGTFFHWNESLSTHVELIVLA